MSRQTLRDAQHRTLGYIETRSDSTQVARDVHYRAVGYFDPRTGVTKDAQYREVGQGNLLASLIVSDCR